MNGHSSVTLSEISILLQYLRTRTTCQVLRYVILRRGVYGYGMATMRCCSVHKRSLPNAEIPPRRCYIQDAIKELSQPLIYIDRVCYLLFTTTVMEKSSHSHEN